MANTTASASGVKRYFAGPVRNTTETKTMQMASVETNAGTDTLVSKGSAEFEATEKFHEDFGDEPVIILGEEDLRKLVLTRDLQSLFELETCLAGGTQLAASLPQREKRPLPGVCDQIAELGIGHGMAAILHDEGRVVVAPHVGQGLGDGLRHADEPPLLLVGLNRLGHFFLTPSWQKPPPGPGEG